MKSPAYIFAQYLCCYYFTEIRESMTWQIVYGPALKLNISLTRIAEPLIYSFQPRRDCLDTADFECYRYV